MNSKYPPGVTITTAHGHNFQPGDYIQIQNKCFKVVSCTGSLLTIEDITLWDRIKGFCLRPFRWLHRQWIYRVLSVWDRFVIWMGWD